jgi:predicted nucleotidyltransferase
MSNLVDTLFSLIDLLDESSIPYAVMGGIAVRAYAVPRPTYDIDLTITIDRKRLPQLFKQLRRLDYSIPEPYETGWVDEVEGLKLLKLRRYLRDESLDVDLFLAETDFQSEVMNRRGEVEVEGRTIWLVSPEDLVLLKLLAARPRDLVDVSDVLFMQGQLDLKYMRKWADELGISAELESKLVEPSAN